MFAMPIDPSGSLGREEGSVGRVGGVGRIDGGLIPA